METEKGIVTRIDSAFAWVKTTRTGTCDSCAAKDSCRVMGGGKEVEVEAINAAGAKIGDEVLIGFKSASLIKLSLLVYTVPILGLMIGALVGQKAAGVFSVDVSALSAVLGILFFLLAFFFVRAKSRRLALKEEYHPKIIRILSQYGRATRSKQPSNAEGAP